MKGGRGREAIWGGGLGLGRADGVRRLRSKEVGKGWELKVGGR